MSCQTMTQYIVTYCKQYIVQQTDTVASELELEMIDIEIESNI